MILVVCTANQCRSPVAAAALRRRLAMRDARVEVESAGLGPSGFPATAPTRDAAAVIGVDLSTHTSRRVDRDMVGRADLVITLERRHTREIVVLDARAWPRTFTLKEFVRRADAVGPRDERDSLAEWVERIHAGRQHHDVLGASLDDDLPDPTVDPLADYDAMVREVDDLVDRLVGLGWPAARPG